jgi:hypothetical protein
MAAMRQVLQTRANGHSAFDINISTHVFFPLQFLTFKSFNADVTDEFDGSAVVAGIFGFLPDWSLLFCHSEL